MSDSKNHISERPISVNDELYKRTNDELHLVSDFLRQYMTYQLTQLPVSVALMGGFFLILWKIKGISIELSILCCIFGAISSGGLWIMWETHAYLIGKLFQRLTFLEGQIDYEIFSKVPGMSNLKWWRRPSAWGQRLFYLSFILIWLVVCIMLIIGKL